MCSVKTTANDQNNNSQWYLLILKGQKSSESGLTVQGFVQSVSESLSMKWNYCLRGLTMFVLNFVVESLEQSVKLRRLVNLRFAWQSPSLNTTFSKPITKKQCFLWCFRCYSCFSVAVAIENLLKTPAIVSLANFQRSQMLRHPRLTFDWLSMSFFDYWPIRMSGLLLLCTESTLFHIELPENCIYLNQSELSNFHPIRRLAKLPVKNRKKGTYLHIILHIWWSFCHFLWNRLDAIVLPDFQHMHLLFPTYHHE